MGESSTTLDRDGGMQRLHRPALQALHDPAGKPPFRADAVTLPALGADMIEQGGALGVTESTHDGPVVA